MTSFKKRVLAAGIAVGIILLAYTALKLWPEVITPDVYRLVICLTVIVCGFYQAFASRGKE